jgi:hypothetical protein
MTITLPCPICVALAIRNPNTHPEGPMRLEAAMPDTCPDCHTPLKPYRRVRGLCPPCYSRRHRHGTHLDSPTRYRTRADVVDDYLVLRSRGITREQIAARLGMKTDALHQALKRAALAGDTRIDYRPMRPRQRVAA